MRVACFSALLFIANAVNAAIPQNGWYTSLFSGFAHVPNTVNTAGLSSAGYKSGYDVGGSFGYKSTPMRYEGELTYLRADLKEFNLNDIQQTGVNGNTYAFLAMANVYYDFNTDHPTVQPFLGFGIGYARVYATFNSTGPFGASEYSGSNNAFAYQFTPGLIYNFAPNYALNFGYRFVATKSVGGLNKSFQASLVNIGIVYRFDHSGE